MSSEFLGEDWFPGNHICNACQLLAGTHYYRKNSACLCTFCDECAHAELNLQGSIHQQVLVAPISTAEAETNPWLLPDFENLQYYWDSEFDDVISLVEQNTCSTEYTSHHQDQPYEFHHGNNGSDCAVPAQNMQKYQEDEQSRGSLNCVTSSNTTIPAFFFDNGVIPKATVSKISHSHGRPQEETLDTAMQPHINRMSREAKILRYREKKKARNFDKRIRYASRKASAEIRERVSGRFAKTTALAEIHWLFS